MPTSADDLYTATANDKSLICQLGGSSSLCPDNNSPTASPTANYAPAFYQDNDDDDNYEPLSLSSSSSTNAASATKKRKKVKAIIRRKQNDANGIMAPKGTRKKTSVANADNVQQQSQQEEKNLPSRFTASSSSSSGTSNIEGLQEIFDTTNCAAAATKNKRKNNEQINKQTNKNSFKRRSR
eukprot:CAMPEP_0198147986 /NCGR_PEP_ID=MMETSP1443-20131203/38957_1 /TAXON_ID=186043 /ORGANISM="Entomoneis sp., Strain CCMP2396" /LENGTH=181 /DNA_ID=CAMNT_0043812533 /DNA_START=170 /DNA_END=716 /DNA_ORIENTATION=-